MEMKEFFCRFILPDELDLKIAKWQNIRNRCGCQETETECVKLNGKKYCSVEQTTESITVVARRINGWTAKGDGYGIEGGQSYIKENGCYHVIFDTVNRVHELWAVPAKELTLEELIHGLEGPYEKREKGPFGRNFLKEYGTKPIFQSRLPPKQKSLHFIICNIITERARNVVAPAEQSILNCIASIINSLFHAIITRANITCSKAHAKGQYFEKIHKATVQYLNRVKSLVG